MKITINNKIRATQTYNYIERARNLITESNKNSLAHEVALANKRFQKVFNKALNAN